MKTVDIYTDGACSANPGMGGYCAILLYQGAEKVISGFEELTTNNRMELLAVIKGLQALKEECKVNLYSDSKYVVEAFNMGWLENWQNNNWKTAGKKPVKNVDLWEELCILTKKHSVTFIHVKGHEDNEYNNRCDQIAVSEYKKRQIK